MSDFRSVIENTILFSLKKALHYESKKSSINHQITKLKNYNGEWQEFLEDTRLLIWSSVVIQRLKLNLNCDIYFEDLAHYLSTKLKLNGNSRSNKIERIHLTNIPEHRLSVIGEHPYLEEIIGNEISGRIENSNNRNKLVEALSKSKELKITEQIDDLLKNIRFLALADEEYGKINSCTCPHFPGFAVISINNPPVLILEQLIHEATHINYDLLLILNIEYLDFIKSISPVFSPIIGKPRPFTKLLTGFFAYLHVYRFWHHVSLLRSKTFKSKLFETEDLVNIKSITQMRLNKTKKLVKDSLYIIENSIPKNKKVIWNNLCNSIITINGDTPAIHNKQISRIKTVDEQIKSILNNKIEIAEILLGINGKKISRISRPIKDAGIVSNWILENDAICYFSPFYFKVGEDEGINGFSNIETERVALDETMDDADIYYYIGRDADEIIDCVHKDEYGDAGRYYEIPHCCRYFFNQNWENAVKNNNGDLASYQLERYLLSKNEMKLFSKECNVFAMYFDNGPLWHFPCSFNCNKTIRMIQKRLQSLKNIDIEIFKLFSQGIMFPIIWSEQFGLGQVNSQPNRSINLNWLGKEIDVKRVIPYIENSLSNNSDHFLYNNRSFNIIQWN